MQDFKLLNHNTWFSILCFTRSLLHKLVCIRNLHFVLVMLLVDTLTLSAFGHSCENFISFYDYCYLLLVEIEGKEPGGPEGNFSIMASREGIKKFTDLRTFPVSKDCLRFHFVAFYLLARSGRIHRQQQHSPSLFAPHFAEGERLDVASVEEKEKLFHFLFMFYAL